MDVRARREPVAARARPASRPPASRAAVWVTDAAFVVLLLATVAFFVARSKPFVFSGDDWRLIRRGGSLADYFRPYNLHLSVVPIATYKVLLHVFGLRTYLPLRLVGIGGQAAVATAIYLVVRSRVGAPVALVAAATMLWYPHLLLTPAAFNHWLALTAVVFCAWALSEDRPALDLPLGLVLGFALASSGVAVAGAVGCLAYLVVTRPPPRRWLAVLVPTAAWGVWWLSVNHEHRTAVARTFSQAEHFVAEGLRRSFEGLVGGNHALGLALMVVFVANLVWRLRRGPRAAAQGLAWSAALLFWWIGLAYSRGLIVYPDAYRYRIVGSAFVVLALLPPKSRAGPLRGPLRGTNPSPSVAAVIVVAALLGAGLVVQANHAGVVDEIGRLNGGYRTIRARLVVTNLGPAVVPDTESIPVGPLGGISARDYRHLTAAHGTPGGTTPDDPDATVIRLDAIRPVPPAGPVPPGPCRPLGSETVAPGATVYLSAGDRDVAVELRRFGPRWVTAGRVTRGRTAAITLRGLGATTPWMLRAPGACGLVTAGPR